jgi:hypothetical protein
MMEATQTSETLVNSYQCTWCYNPEDSHLHHFLMPQVHNILPPSYTATHHHTSPSHTTTTAAAAATTATSTAIATLPGGVPRSLALEVTLGGSLEWSRGEVPWMQVTTAQVAIA